MFLHLSVSHSVQRPGTPWSRQSPEEAPPRGGIPWDQVPPGADTPWTRNPLGANTPRTRQLPKQTPRRRHPRDQAPQTATVADGTRPTGMHSCLFIIFAQGCAHFFEFGCFSPSYAKKKNQGAQELIHKSAKRAHPCAQQNCFFDCTFQF